MIFFNLYLFLFGLADWIAGGLSGGVPSKSRPRMGAGIASPFPS